MVQGPQWGWHQHLCGYELLETVLSQVEQLAAATWEGQSLSPRPHTWCWLVQEAALQRDATGSQSHPSQGTDCIREPMYTILSTHRLPYWKSENACSLVHCFSTPAVLYTSNTYRWHSVYRYKSVLHLITPRPPLPLHYIVTLGHNGQQQTDSLHYWIPTVIHIYTVPANRPDTREVRWTILLRSHITPGNNKLSIAMALQHTGAVWVLL